MKIASSLSIRDLRSIFDSLAPTAIYIDGKCVWDDNDFTEYQSCRNKYNEVLNSEKIIKCFNIRVVHFHHSIIYIYTVMGG